MKKIRFNSPKSSCWILCDTLVCVCTTKQWWLLHFLRQLLYSNDKRHGSGDGNIMHEIRFNKTLWVRSTLKVFIYNLILLLKFRFKDYFYILSPLKSLRTVLDWEFVNPRLAVSLDWIRTNEPREHFLSKWAWPFYSIRFLIKLNKGGR